MKSSFAFLKCVKSQDSASVLFFFGSVFLSVILLASVFLSTKSPRGIFPNKIIHAPYLAIQKLESQNLRRHFVVWRSVSEMSQAK